MNKTQLKMFVIVMIAMITPIILCSQPIITIDFPTYGSTNISTEPKVTFHVSYPYKIDVSCLDSSGKGHDPRIDTILNRKVKAEIYLFNNSYYSESDSSLSLACIYGAYTSCKILNDTTLLVYPRQYLEFNTDYGIYFDDFRVYNSVINDTLICDTIMTNCFRTTEPMYEIANCSIFENQIRTNDTIKVTFNRKLFSDTTESGRLLILKRITNNEEIDSVLIEYNYEEYPSYTFLSADSLSCYILPYSNYSIGNQYLLEISLDKLTGEKLDFASFGFSPRENASLIINSMIKDTSDSLPKPFFPNSDSCKFYLGDNEQFEYGVPEYEGDFFFVGWESEQILSLNGTTSPTFSIQFDSDEFNDYHLTAVYARIPKDEISITQTSGTISTYTTGDKINDSTYTLPRKRGESFEITVREPSGYKFSHWSSNDTTINGKTDFVLSVNAYTLGYNPSIQKNKKEQVQDFPIIYEPYFINITPVFEEILDYSSMGWNFEVVYNKGDYFESYSNGKLNYEESANFVLSDIIEAFVTPDGQTRQQVDFSDLNKYRADAGLTYTGNTLPWRAKMEFKIKEEFRDIYEISYYKEKNTTPNYDPGGRLPETHTRYERYGLPHGPEIIELNVSIDSDEPENIYPQEIMYIEISRKRHFLTVEFEYDDYSDIWHYKDFIYKADFQPGSGLAKVPYWVTVDWPIGTWHDENPRPEKYFFAKTIKVVYIVPHDEKIKVSPIISTGNPHCLEYLHWSEDVGYIYNDVINTSFSPHTLEVTMNDNIKSKYIFSTGFRIHKIGFLDSDGQFPESDNDLIYNWVSTRANFFSPKIVGIRKGNYMNTEFGKRFYLDLENEKRYSNYMELLVPSIKLEFNRKVDITSITPNVLIATDIINETNSTEPLLKRFDGEFFRTYKFNTNYNRQISSDGKILTLDLLDFEGRGMPHMQNFNLSISNLIRSDETVPKLLSCQRSFKTMTECPFIHFKLYKWELVDSYDGGEDEPWSNACFGFYNEETKEKHFDWVQFGYDSRSDGPRMEAGDVVNLMESYLSCQSKRQLNKATNIKYGYCSFEIDNSEVDREKDDIRTKTENKLNKEFFGDWRIGCTIHIVIKNKISTISWDPDDYIYASDKPDSRMFGIDKLNYQNKWGLWKEKQVLYKPKSISTGVGCMYHLYWWLDYPWHVNSTWTEE